MSQLHIFKVEPVDGSLSRARVLIDNDPIKCSGYSIKHKPGEIPKVELELCCVPNYEHGVFMRVSNKEEIARLMDKSEFEEFCRIWKRLYEMNEI